MLANRLRMNGKRLDEYTKALLHFDGVEGSKVFIDETSIGNFTAFNDNASYIINTAYKFGGGSIFFEPLTYISDLLYNPSTEISTKDFTVDFWHNMTAINTYKGLFSIGSSPTVRAYITDTNKIGVLTTEDSGSSRSHSPQTLLVANQWYHIEFVKLGTTFYIFLNGVNIWESVLPSIKVPPQGFFIGSSNTYKGNNNKIDEFRFSLGIARHTANFTPPTAPY